MKSDRQEKTSSPQAGFLDSKEVRNLRRFCYFAKITYGLAVVT